MFNGLQAVDATAILLLLFALPAYLHYVDVPQIRAAILSGRPGARVSAYRKTILQQWGIAGLVLAGWASASRAWFGLRLTWPAGGALWITLALVAGGVALAWMQASAIARTPAALPAVRKQFAGIEWFLPHTAAEAGWFRVLSVTAGVCEEVVFRGYLLWGLDRILPLPGAVVLQALVFGVAHSYQGTKGIVKTGIVGLIMGAIAAATGSLLAPIVIHAAVDLSGGAIAFRALGPGGTNAGTNAGAPADARGQETARTAQSMR